MTTSEPEKKKRGRPKLTEEQKQARAKQEARHRIDRAISVHVGPEGEGLWRDLVDNPDPDINIPWRLAMVEVQKITRELSAAEQRKEVKRIDMYRRRLANYLELARKLALTKAEIDQEPVSELTIYHHGLTSSVFTDETGAFIPPKIPEDEEVKH